MSLPHTPAAALRVMELRDIPAVAHIHTADLAQGFFVELGERFLARYYRTFLTSPAGVALVAEVDGQLVGFLAGSVDITVHHRHVVDLDRWRLARAGAASLLVRPRLTVKFVRTRAQRYAGGIKRASQRGPGLRVGVLNHIAVDRGARRSGVGRRLVAAFVDIAKAHGVQRLQLQTAGDNLAAQHFYTGLGWAREGEVRDPDGKGWVPFHIDLSYDDAS